MAQMGPRIGTRAHKNHDQSNTQIGSQACMAHICTLKLWQPLLSYNGKDGLDKQRPDKNNVEHFSLT
jgi:hypothetical protein